MRPSLDLVLNAVPANASINSAAVDIGFVLAISAQVVYSGTGMNGSLKLQVSNDIPPAGNLASFTPTNWTDLTGASIVLSGGPGTNLIVKTEVTYQWVRVVYTNSGTPTGTVTVIMKSLGF